MSCPIPTNPQWKALVKKNGRKKAMQIFVANNYQVPDVKDIPKTFYDVIKGFIVSQGSTLQRIQDDPALTSKIIDDLKKIMPEVIINKGGVIKEDGTFVPLKAGEAGESIRNALHAMVAWSNDAYLETPPHEYAHIYIDMYQNAPMVKKAIEKYGKEKLVEKIGRYYTEQYTAPGFKKWVQRFWNMLRSMFGQPNIQYELFKAFKENKQLSTDVTRGTDIVEYQKIKTPYKRNDTAYVQDPKLKDQVEHDSQQSYNFQKDSKGLEKNVALKQVVLELINSKKFEQKGRITLDSLVPGTTAFMFADLDKSTLSSVLINLREFYNDKITELKDFDKSQDSNYKNVNFFDENDLDKIIESYSVSKEANSDAILAWSMFTLFKLDDTFQNDDIFKDFQWEKFGIEENSKEALKVITKGSKLAKDIHNIQKRIERVKWQKTHVVLPNGKSISIDAAAKIARDEINDASKKRKDFWYNKGFIGKNPALKKFFKVVVQLLNTYLSNARLQSKFLSGKADSAIQQMLYEEFENARHTKLKIKRDALRYFNQVLKDSQNLDGSYYKNRGKSINELSTVEVELGGRKVNLTEAELLNLYLMIRMDTVEDGTRKSTREQIVENGIVLQNVINDRELPTRKFTSITDQDLDNIKTKVESNGRMKKNIALIDATMESLYEELNKAHMNELGVELKNVKNYFPTVYGLKSESEMRRKKKFVDFIGARYLKKTGVQPVNIRDAYEAVNNYAENASHYSGYILPISNARKLLKNLKRTYEKQTSREDYKIINDLLKSLEGNVNNLEDNSILYSSQGEKSSARFFNKIMNNVSTAVLSLNVPVMFKQPISYQAAGEVIDSKYLQMAGWGKGMISGISYKEVLSQMHKKKMGDNNSIFPVEFRMDDSNPLYAIIKKYSPVLEERFEGAISREVGEAMMDSRIGDDTITVPFGNYLKQVFGKQGDLKISKNAMMSGIKAFDIATVSSIWKAVQFEAKEVLGLSEADGDAFYEHVAKRTEEIVKKTQPTFDTNNRSALASDKSSIARFLTMFGSARSKLAMLMIEGAVDLMNNPTTENKHKFVKRSVNIMVLSAMAVVAVDILKTLTLGSGFDDPEEVAEFAGWKMLSTSLGNFYGLSQIVDTVISNLDDEPWRRNIQDPMSALAQDVSAVIYNTFKGDFDKSALKAIEATFKSSGAPLYPYVAVKNIVKRTTD